MGTCSFLQWLSKLSHLSPSLGTIVQSFNFPKSSLWIFSARAEVVQAYKKNIYYYYCYYYYYFIKEFLCTYVEIFPILVSAISQGEIDSWWMRSVLHCHPPRTRGLRVCSSFGRWVVSAISFSLGVNVDRNVIQSIKFLNLIQRYRKFDAREI